MPLSAGDKASAIHAGILSTKGQVLQRYAYGPFGATRFLLNPNLGAPTPAHAALLTTPAYTGHRALPGLGLVTTPARDLDPTWGRFLTPDPVVADPTDAQSYNRYAYVRHNPFPYTDPTGWELEEGPYTEANNWGRPDDWEFVGVTFGAEWDGPRDGGTGESAANLVGATKLPGTSYPSQRRDLPGGFRRVGEKCSSA